MARIWVEPYHQHSESTYDQYWRYERWGIADDHRRAPTLIPKNVMMVSVASFTFQFFSVEQIRECLSYYERKIHPTSRRPSGGMSHWEAQDWFERLPMFLLEEPKRAKVVVALCRALALAESGVFSEPL
jgi:hypothetical protein